MNYNFATGKLIYDDACVCNAKTGEVIHTFEGADLLRGRQYWRAWCIGHYYRIIGEDETEYLADDGDRVCLSFIFYVK